MTASSSDSAPEAGAPANVPEGVTFETLKTAVQIIEDWETAGSHDPVELFLQLRTLVKNER